MEPSNNGDFRIQAQRKRMIARIDEVAPQTDETDNPIWLWSKDSKCSVSSYYKIIPYKGQSNMAAKTI